MDTTLRGAASTVALMGGAPKPRRTPLVAGIAVAAIAVAAMLVVVRGNHDEDGPTSPVAVSVGLAIPIILSR